MISILPMYSAGHVAAATFLGGPLGGAWLLALNYKRLGEPGKARAAVGVTVLAVAALLAISFATSSRMSWLALASIFVMHRLAKSLQGAAYKRHVSVGGSVGSIWRVIGVALASLAISLGAVVGAELAYGYATAPDDVVVGDSTVRYTGGATRAEAQAAGEALAALGYLRAGMPSTVELTLDRGRHVVELVVQDFVFSDDKIQLQLHELAGELSRRAFAGAQVDLWLTDDSLEPRVKLPWDTRPRSLDAGDHHTVVYRQGGREAEARGVAEVLQERGFFQPGRPATVIVETVSSRHVVALTSSSSAFDDAAIKAAIHELADPLSQAAFGGDPVDLWLQDEEGVPRVKLIWETRPQ